MMNIAYFSALLDSTLHRDDYFLKVFDNFESFEASDFKPDCVILDDFPIIKITNLIKSLRQSDKFFLTPLFTTQSYEPPIMYLCDGVVSLVDIENIKNIVTEINELSAILPSLTNSYDIDTKLLQYLFTRNNKNIMPFSDWRKEKIYLYPLIDFLAISEIDSLPLLTNLVSRKLISQIELIDRLHCCPICNSPHINFTDVCPNCHSINLNETEFLHCFTCGHVAPQADFMVNNRLHCPRCQTVLRHIGTDYDRPVENYHCNDCQENFPEPEVIAHCLICGTKSETDKLVSTNIYSYELTNLGRLNTRNNSITDIYSLLDHLNYMNPVYFNNHLSWMMHLAIRHTEINFGVLGIEIQGLDQIVAKHGRFIGHEVMEGAAERVRQIIRDTDITTRTSENRLWLLVPQTSGIGCNILAKRLDEVASLSLQENGDHLTFKIVIIFSADLRLADETAETLLGKLNAELDK